MPGCGEDARGHCPAARHALSAGAGALFARMFDDVPGGGEQGGID